MSQSSPEPGESAAGSEGAEPVGPREATGPAEAPTPAELTMREDLEVRVRRSPRYLPFIMLGVVAGFVVAGILSVLPVDTSQLSGEFSRGQAAGILMAVLGIAGGFIGAIVVLFLDRRSVRRAGSGTVTAEYRSELIPPTREELVAQAKAQLAAEREAKRTRGRTRPAPERASGLVFTDLPGPADRDQSNRTSARPDPTPRQAPAAPESHLAPHPQPEEGNR